MSRHIQDSPQYQMAYGRDHIFGLFIQVFERARANDEDEGIVVDLDQHHHGLTPEKMAEVAEEYGFYIQLGEQVIR